MKRANDCDNKAGNTPSLGALAVVITRNDSVVSRATRVSDFSPPRRLLLRRGFFLPGRLSAPPRRLHTRNEATTRHFRRPNLRRPRPRRRFFCGVALWAVRSSAGREYLTKRGWTAAEAQLSEIRVRPRLGRGFVECCLWRF